MNGVCLVATETTHAMLSMACEEPRTNPSYLPDNDERGHGDDR